MKHSVLCYAVATAVVIFATSCVDDDYDLTDIDSTVRLQVKELTIPVTLDPIEMSTVLSESDNIKIVNGAYSVSETGRFTSSPVKINSINLSFNTSGSVTTNIELPWNSGTQHPTDNEIFLPVSSDNISFNLQSNDVPSEIQSIEEIKGDFTLTFDIAFSSQSVRNLKNGKIQLPKGLITDNANYNPSTGVFTISSKKLVNGKLTIVLNCTGINYAQSGASFDPMNHTAILSGNVRIISGDISIDNSTGNLPNSLSLTTSNHMSPISVKKFTGRIKYDIKGVNISDVDLSDLPDLLNQDGTQISLSNPQIYLNVENPLYTYGLGATASLSITKHFAPEQGSPEQTYSSDLINVSNAASSAYVLAPRKPDQIAEGFSNPTFVRFADLSEVLMGNGLPRTLSIDLIDPQVYEQRVEDLVLGEELGIVNGTYDFVAPLQLNANSQVVYTTTEDGWNDDDVDKITVQTLIVKAIATSTVPFALHVEAYPIDVNGNKINNVEIVGADLGANCKNQELVIRITGEVTHLDGIHIVAKGYTSDNMTKPISPDQSLTLNNLKATVSGYYDTEL